MPSGLREWGAETTVRKEKAVMESGTDGTLCLEPGNTWSHQHLEKAGRNLF